MLANVRTCPIVQMSYAYFSLVFYLLSLRSHPYMYLFSLLYLLSGTVSITYYTYLAHLGYYTC